MRSLQCSAATQSKDWRCNSKFTLFSLCWNTYAKHTLPCGGGVCFLFLLSGRVITVVRFRCRGVARKRSKVECSFEGCNNNYINNHHRPREMRLRCVLTFRSVVVGVAKANQIRDLDILANGPLSYLFSFFLKLFFFSKYKRWCLEL